MTSPLHPPLTPPPTEPFEHWFYIHEWAPLIIFFGTYLGIVRNKKIPHVARYHIMMVRGPRPGGGTGMGVGVLQAVLDTRLYEAASSMGVGVTVAATFRSQESSWPDACLGEALQSH